MTAQVKMTLKSCNGQQMYVLCNDISFVID